MHILLIEDNDSIAEIVRRSLATFSDPDHDYVLDCAVCGVEGLRFARAKAFDGYLIDLDLPDIHGLQVGLALRHLMRRGRVTSAWMAAVTAQSDATTIQHARELGFNAFLGKPFSPSDLQTLLRHFEALVVAGSRKVTP
ncbi:MAG: response regulator [Aggregatilineales bacterium]